MLIAINTVLGSVGSVLFGPVSFGPVSLGPVSLGSVYYLVERRSAQPD